MPEFRLYFKDSDEAHAAEKRVVAYNSEIRTEDDVRTDLRDFFPDAPDILGIAREYQARLREQHGGVAVAWPASRYDDAPDLWELILVASSIEDVQAFVGVDLDYSWETG